MCCGQIERRAPLQRRTSCGKRIQVVHRKGCASDAPRRDVPRDFNLSAMSPIWARTARRIAVRTPEAAQCGASHVYDVPWPATADHPTRIEIRRDDGCNATGGSLICRKDPRIYGLAPDRNHFANPGRKFSASTAVDVVPTACAHTYDRRTVNLWQWSSQWCDLHVSATLDVSGRVAICGCEKSGQLSDPGGHHAAQTITPRRESLEQRRDTVFQTLPLSGRVPSQRV